VPAPRGGHPRVGKAKVKVFPQLAEGPADRDSVDGSNRRRSTVQVLEVPGALGVEILLAHGETPRSVPATVDRLTRETVLLTFRSGIDALAVASAPGFSLRFRAGDMVIESAARPGRRDEDVVDSRTLEVVLVDD
jgi:hypothetical protein